MPNIKSLNVPFLIASIYVVFAINPSFAYEYGGVKWPDSNIPVEYYINENTDDTTGEGSACQAAAQTWSNVSSSSFEFKYRGSTGLNAPNRDRVNVISWGSTGGSIATTYIWYVGDTIVECDMEFDDGFEWGTTGASNRMDVQNIAAHEFGHFLLLLDLYSSADTEKTMYGFARYGETKNRTLHSDDIAGISFVYPSTTGPSITADFTANTRSGNAPLPVQFTDLSTGNISEWTWDFGDGSPTSTDRNPSHTYTSSGSYTVTLEVSGVDGSDTATKNTYINVRTINADFTANPEKGIIPLTVQFTDLSEGDISGWLWNFGDGQTSSLQNPSHTYNDRGRYTVTLKVTGTDGSDTTTTKTDYIRVRLPYVTMISPDSGSVGTLVTIHGNGFGTTQGEGYVLFKRRKRANTVSWSDNKIECLVPAGARSGAVKVKNSYKIRGRVFFAVTK